VSLTSDAVMRSEPSDDRLLEKATQLAGAPLTVTAFNALARQVIERALPLLWVAGEISNFTRAASGHCYFTLKDERSQVRCVLFRTRAQSLDFSPANGMQAEVRATPTLYEARGDFQLTVDFIRRGGLGVLFERFARLKAKLEAEGLFALERKRPLPRFPRRIGTVTSPAGAALRDVLTTLRRRMPGIPVVVYPTQVQGDGAASQIADAIALAAARGECDVLILCRGGGSIEDLWAFNEEGVARAIAASPIPIVCGVGHETDFTIADFVADWRAPTPTGAAAAASADRSELLAHQRALLGRLQRAMQRALERRMQHTDLLARRLVHPGERIANQLAHLTHLQRRLASAWSHGVERRRLPIARVAHRVAAARPDVARLGRDVSQLRDRLGRAFAHRLQRQTAGLDRLDAHLRHLDPRQILERGYAIVTDEHGTVMRSSAQLAVGSAIEIALGHGSASAQVTKTSS
jgi:exodeoxyribonuclease VII large subunit